MPPTAKTVIAERRRLRASLYDRVSSMLLAVLVTVGAVVSLLFVIWVSNRIFVPRLAVPVAMTEVSEVGEGEGGGDGRPAGGSQLDSPSDEPVVGDDKKTTEIQGEASALNAAVTSRAAELDDPEVLQPTRHGSYGSGGGIYGGFGDGRGLGHGPGKPGIPRHWEVVFSKATLAEYAKQLDFFHIELAVLLPGNKIAYVSNLAKSRPDSRIVENPGPKERRYYLTWRTGEMQKADQQLLARAGIDAEGRLILKFLPPEIEAQLVSLEQSYRGAEPKKIGRTSFGVQPSGDGFSFFVLEQTLKM